MVTRRASVALELPEMEFPPNVSQQAMIRYLGVSIAPDQACIKFARFCTKNSACSRINGELM